MTHRIDPLLLAALFATGVANIRTFHVSPRGKDRVDGAHIGIRFPPH